MCTVTCKKTPTVTKEVPGWTWNNWPSHFNPSVQNHLFLCTFLESTINPVAKWKPHQKTPPHTTLNTFSKLKKLSHLHSQLPGCKLPAESALSQLPNTFKCCKWFKQKYSPQDFPWYQDSNYGELYRPKRTQWITLRNVVEAMKCGT